jgi:hypothetical protein
MNSHPVPQLFPVAGLYPPMTRRKAANRMKFFIVNAVGALMGISMLLAAKSQLEALFANALHIEVHIPMLWACLLLLGDFLVSAIFAVYYGRKCIEAWD